MKSRNDASLALCRLIEMRKLLFLIAIMQIALLFGCSGFSDLGNNDSDDGTQNCLSSIEGTWKDNNSTNSFTINSIHVLFQYPNPVPPGNMVTYGNFQYVSYDGSTVSIYDFDDQIVTFTAVLENDILTVSGLNTIKIFDEPFDARDYRPWNTTYTKL